MSSGGRSTCGITTDGRAYCWGINFIGQLGDGATGNGSARSADRRRAPALRFRQITYGLLHTCAVTTDDLAYCWGDNSGGQLGDKTTTDRTTPVRVLGGHKFRDVRAGYSSTCGVTTTGESYCWGDQPLRARSGTTRSSTGWCPAWCAAATASAASCPARGTPAASRPPTRPTAGAGTSGASSATAPRRSATCRRRWPAAAPYKNVSASTSHTCGFTTGGAVYCWGINRTARLGDGTTTTPHSARAGQDDGHARRRVPGQTPIPARCAAMARCSAGAAISSADRRRHDDHPPPAPGPGRGQRELRRDRGRACSHLRSDRGSLRPLLGRQPVRPARPGHYSQKEGFPQGVEPPF